MQTETNPVGFMGLVLSNGTKLPTSNELKAAVEARVDGASFLFPTGDKVEALSFQVSGFSCVLLPVEAPAPFREGDEAFSVSWYWPNAWDVVKEHKSHLVVSVQDGDSSVDRALLFQQLIAAGVMAVESTVAFHCATSDNLWPAQVAGSLIPARTDAVVTPIFVSVGFGREDASLENRSQYFGVTKGLAAFGMMELETYAFPGKPPAINEELLGVAAYLIDRGPILADGNTINRTTDAKAIVRHQLSRRWSDQIVHALHYE